MTRSARKLAAGWLGLLLSAACGGGDGDSIGDATAAFGEAYCPRLFECCSAGELAEKFEGSNPPITDVEGCQAYFSGLGGLIELSLDSGRASLSAERMSECVDQVSAWSCDQVRAEEPLADRLCDAIDGLVELGGSCGQDMECSAGYCDRDGTCRELPGAGQACTGDCGDGFYCKITDAGDLCVEVKADGEACSFDNTCASGACNDDLCGPRNECIEGLLRVSCGPCTE